MLEFLRGQNTACMNILLKELLQDKDLSAKMKLGCDVLPGSGWPDDRKLLPSSAAKPGARLLLPPVHRLRRRHPHSGPHLPEPAGI